MAVTDRRNVTFRFDFWTQTSWAWARPLLYLYVCSWLCVVGSMLFCLPPSLRYIATQVVVCAGSLMQIHPECMARGHSGVTNWSRLFFLAINNIFSTGRYSANQETSWVRLWGLALLPTRPLLPPRTVCPSGCPKSFVLAGATTCRFIVKDVRPASPPACVLLVRG